MKILFFDWASFGDRDIVDTFSILGHTVVLSSLRYTNEQCDDVFVDACCRLLDQQAIEVVFTSNYYPVVAKACYRKDVKYAAWVYDSPQLLLYHKSIHYPTNYVFLFDSVEYDRLSKLGLETVYYMPLAVNTQRLDQMHADTDQQRYYDCDIAFVGSLYNEEHKLYDRMLMRMADYDRGYLDAMLQAQRNVYGYYFLEERLRDSDILQRMSDAMPYDEDPDSFVTKEYIYANYFMGRKLAEIERTEVLQTLGPVCKVHAYTEGDVSAMSGVHKMNCVNYYDEMPFAFRYAKINLNISLRTIQSGIPLRCFDIMGAGGFLLTNYQKDFTPLFEPGVDYVYYDSREDMYHKIAYYLENEDERIQIARNGHDKVLKYHGYGNRLSKIMKIVMG